ncbi:hypothetical protein ACFXPR_36080 [Nocardia tengchongensis]|uniref:hypothetical protein n=1 Tax=Nocardia tengchongensis TaxID=2055889 RepID=UPI00368E41A5
MSDLTAAGPRKPPLASALSVVAAITSQAAVLGGIMLYFGTVYSRAWYGYFGIDIGMLNLSTADFIQKAFSKTFWPVVFRLLILLALISARRIPFVIAYKSRKPRLILRLWYVFTLTAGSILLATVAAKPWIPAISDLSNKYFPDLLVASSLLLGYAVTLRTAYPALLRPPSAPGQPRFGVREPILQNTTMVMFALLTLGAAGTTWSIGDYARDSGIEEAKTLTQNGFPDQPSVVVFSVERLAIFGKGSQVDPIPIPGEKFRYMYSGLRLLARTTDSYFVIPQEWKPRLDRVFVIPRSDDVRIDLDTTRND